MNSIFLETSAVATLFYKSPSERKALETTIPEGAILISSQYVVFELSRGFVQYLIWIHNRATLVTKFSDLYAYCNSMRRRINFTGAMFEMFKFFEQYVSDNGLTAPREMPMDEYKLVIFRAFVRRTIRRSWSNFHKRINSFVNNVGCRSIPPPTTDAKGQFTQELRTRLCGKRDKCGLKDYVGSHRRDFEKLQLNLSHIKNPDPETTKRVTSLHELYRWDKKEFQKSDCYNCGDPIIAHEAPAEHPILTLNHKHFEPISKIFQKQLVPLAGVPPQDDETSG